MSKIKIAEAALLALADAYEHNNVRWPHVMQESVAEYTDFKTRYATLVAKGLLRTDGNGVYQFTDAGYLEYSAQINALRAFAPS